MNYTQLLTIIDNDRLSKIDINYADKLKLKEIKEYCKISFFDKTKTSPDEWFYEKDKMNRDKKLNDLGI
jgi:hypothetical protein